MHFTRDIHLQPRLFHHECNFAVTTKKDATTNILTSMPESPQVQHNSWVFNMQCACFLIIIASATSEFPVWPIPVKQNTSVAFSWSNRSCPRCITVPSASICWMFHSTQNVRIEQRPYLSLFRIQTTVRCRNVCENLVGWKSLRAPFVGKNNLARSIV